MCRRFDIFCVGRWLENLRLKPTQPYQVMVWTNFGKIFLIKFSFATSNCGCKFTSKISLNPYYPISSFSIEWYEVKIKLRSSEWICFGLLVDRFFSCDSSSISHNVGRSVCLSVGRSVGRSVRNESYRSVILLVVYICCYYYCSLDY